MLRGVTQAKVQAKTPVKRKTRSATAPKSSPSRQTKLKKTVQPNAAKADKAGQQDTAYEKLLRKVEENKRKRAANEKGNVSAGSKRQRDANETEIVQFQEEDNIMELEVSKITERAEFPTPSEDEEDEEQEDSDVPEEGELIESSKNNNATVAGQNATGWLLSTQRLTSAAHDNRPEFLDAEPSTSDGRTHDASSLGKTIALMQTFMVKKGLIDTSMTDEEIEQFVSEGLDINVTDMRTEPNTPHKSRESGYAASQLRDAKGTEQRTGKQAPISQSSTSEMTIYKRVVQQIAPGLQQQIDKFVNDTRQAVMQKQDHEFNTSRKISSSSDELMDISDECDNNAVLLAGRANDNAARVLTADEKANEYVREAERARARMLDVEGRNCNTNLSNVDNDYQMIDAHLDESIKRKIWNYEFIDFSKLLVKGRMGRDEDTRFEFIVKNGQTYLTPVSEREGASINNYAKREQAFHIFSNVLTSRYPEKAMELLQYNHTTHSAAMSYHWENISAYDKEFRHHIARYPGRSWNIILQQAWTILLKDCLKHDMGPFQRQNYTKKGGEPCRRFNRGKCTFGLSCKYDHHCSVKKCGKFGHRAFQCRMRNEGTSSTSEKGVNSASLPDGTDTKNR